MESRCDIPAPHKKFVHQIIVQRDRRLASTQVVGFSFVAPQMAPTVSSIGTLGSSLAGR
jgi:hypothetical protein